MGSRSRSTLVVGLVRDPDASPAMAQLVDLADTRGDGHRRLGPLDADGVRAIAAVYAGDDVQEVPLESIARASGGVPGRVHEVMSEWAEQEATRRLAASAEFLATERRTRSADLEFANNIIGLKLGRLYGDAGTVVDASYGDCPYKGLAPFEEADAALVLRPGAARRRACRPDGGRRACSRSWGRPEAGSRRRSRPAWFPRFEPGCCRGAIAGALAVIRPGEHPMAELEHRRAAQWRRGRVVLVVDQFEEVFTTCRDDGGAKPFCRATRFDGG